MRCRPQGEIQEYKKVYYYHYHYYNKLSYTAAKQWRGFHGLEKPDFTMLGAIDDGKILFAPELEIFERGESRRLSFIHRGAVMKCEQLGIHRTTMLDG